MIYETLASLYDGLVKDDEATKMYLDFINKHATFNSVLELGCGSGEIALGLALEKKVIDATDLSEDMLKMAKVKDKNHLVNYYCMDMREFNINKNYDLVICLCDSINYLKECDLDKLFKDTYNSLNYNGTFIFDMHSLDRLVEFQEEFYEAGIIDNHEYTWSIIAEDNCLFQNFIFYDEDKRVTYENHIQYIFDPNKVIKLLEKIGFSVEIYTDFDLEGIQEGEKYFLVCKRGN